MKVLALNSSPRSDQESSTVFMLNHLIKGMTEAGAAVEKINLKDKKIRHCTGCYTCWTKTPGTCVLKDDMTCEIFPKLAACDLVIYASPLYYHTINSRMSALIERTLPFSQPFFAQNENGKTCHPPRYESPPALLLSVCGFPEPSEFDAMRDFFARTRPQKGKLVASICRSSAGMMQHPAFKEKTKQIIAATQQAGREVVQSMQITSQTLATICQQFIDAETFARLGNMYWQTCIDEGVTPKIYAEKQMRPRPRSIEDFMFAFPVGANAASAGDSRKSVQFIFSGDVKGICSFTIEKGRIETIDGSVDNPDLLIDTPFDLWMDIMTGKADGAQMFMEQKYSVTGDMEWMTQLFSGR